LIVVPDPATNAHRKLINELAARNRLPVIHALRAATVDGGLMSDGVDLPNVFRQAAATPIASSRVPTPPTCRSTCRPSSSWYLISQPQRP
jgi:hypothetical protein